MIYAFTVGNLGYDGFSFLDDLQHAGKRQWMYGFMAGMIFNLGNMLLMAAVSVAGLSVAFPMTMGIALLVGTGMGIAGRPAGNTLLMGLGCALVLTSVVVNAVLVPDDGGGAARGTGAVPGTPRVRDGRVR